MSSSIPHFWRAFMKIKMAAASNAANPRKTLAEILNVEPELLREKFHLEPFHSYDPHKKDNLVFLSPIVCLEDLELREGGWKDRGAKEVLGLLAKDILKSKDCSLFQVPEITFFQMGYGKASENKKTNMAINEFEAKAWMDVFDLAARKAHLSSNPCVDDKNGTSVIQVETPMEEDFSFPAPEDTHAHERPEEDDDSEDVIYPGDSGLEIVVKPSYLLFFSILMIFYKKKLEVTASRKINIGGNKISDFLLFWLLPYLLNYTELQKTKVNKHHCRESNRRKGAPDFSVPSVAMSAKDIIKDAFRSCKVPGKLQEKLLTRLKKYYGTDKLEHKYNLPAVETSGKLFPFNKEPVILVPLRYQVKDMPVDIEDIGSRWREIGNITLLDEFINKFIDNREIQEDILLDSFRELELKERCSVNYGILLPDEKTFTALMEMVEENPDIFRNLKCTVIDKQGRNLNTPRIGFVKNGGTYLSVCFSYFEGNNGQKVAALFRTIGSNRVNHFTLAVLHGACLNPHDPTCKLLNLYPVTTATRFKFENGRLQKCQLSEEKVKKIGDSFIKGHFCKLEFPQTCKLFYHSIRTDKVIKAAVMGSRGKLKAPRFENQFPLSVAYTVASQTKRLKRSVLGAAVAKVSPKQSLKKRLEIMKKYQVRAASLEGCLLHKIERSGPENNTAVVMAINDTLEPYGACLPHLAKALRRVIAHFVMAVVVAGLPKAYPAAGSDADREIESGSDEDDDDDYEGGDDYNEDMNYDRGHMSAGPSAVISTPFVSALQVKQGKPSNEELEKLSLNIAQGWKSLGRRLGIDEARLTGFDEGNKEYSEKPYKMLLHWMNREGSSATYKLLYDALCHELVNRKDLAEKLCLFCVE